MPGIFRAIVEVTSLREFYFIWPISFLTSHRQGRIYREITNFSFWATTCIGPFRGPYQCPINLTARIWKKLDRGFSKIWKKKILILYMSLPTASCKSEKNVSTLSIIIRNETWINHVRGKTELSFYSLHWKGYCKIVAIWRGLQRVWIQKMYWIYCRCVSGN